MNYLSVENLSKAYGTKVLFDKLTFGISQNQKVALVAQNGGGKTTLLNILAGKDMPDSGEVVVRKSLTLSYLQQEPEFPQNTTVIDVLFDDQNPMAQAVKAYETAMQAEDHQAIETLTHTLENLNAWNYEADAKQILSRLSLTDFNQSVSTLSGGQRKRLALAQVLIQKPDLLIMDEPTNHLDIDMVEWLEEWLQNSNLTLLLVTHDRYFLDRVCDEILELDKGQLFRYKGNYSYYIEKKAEREIAQAAEIDKARNTYRRELEWVRRMPKARGTKAKARVDAFSDIKDKAMTRTETDKLQLSVKMTRLGGKILELIGIRKRYGDKVLLQPFSYVFKRGEKIGIVGKNGVGKSTFLNMILGLESYDAGKITTGETIVFGYYSQMGMAMPEDKRVIEVVRDFGDYIPMADGTMLPASQLLTRFLFPPDVQYSFVSKLSGGERRRLYLMTLLIQNPNFLILDEPTNDLDIVTLGILEDFLADFPGCVLIVTHDRYFMDRLADHLFVFEGEGIVRDFPGNYSDYRNSDFYKQGKNKSADAPSPAKNEIKAAADTEAVKSQKRKPSFKEKFEFEQLEKEIAELEARKSAIETEMNSGTAAHDVLITLTSEFKQVSDTLDEKSLRWLELSELF